MHAGRARQIPSRSILGGNREDLAASAEESPFPVRRNADVRDVFADIAQTAAAGFVIVVDLHRNLRRRRRGEVEAVEPAAILVNDRIVAERWELDVEIAVLRQPLDRL